MLTQLSIRNFAIIDSLELEFPAHMTVITGETGAGKSIAIDALGLALGQRADPTMVRHGSNRSEITASFDINQLPQVQKWLVDQELDEDGDCILRRTISSEGGSRAYINGRPVPLQHVKAISERLVDIHSQHQHQSLLRQDEQRQLLDNYGRLHKLTENVKYAHKSLHALQKEYEQLKTAADERAARIDFLQFQIDELSALDVNPDEWKQLGIEHKKLANVEKIQQSVDESIQLLYQDDGSVSSQLNHVRQTIQGLIEFEPELVKTASLLDEASINIEESINDLRHQVSEDGFDSAHFENIESRMSDLLDMSRKHRCEPDQLYQFLEKLQSEITPLRNAEETLDGLQASIENAKVHYDDLAVQLTKKRLATAKKLKKECEKIVNHLGMKDTRLEFQLLPLENNQSSAHGNEKVSIAISTNPGSPLKPLSKVASGGELSRVSLAIQVVTASVTHIPTLVFDEVDVGIGGGVAEVVGNLLKTLGATKQIICITHQAQVAAKGNTHWMVEKQKRAKQVSTKIITLENDDRVIEIARMIGGLKLTAATQKHAKEMLMHSQTETSID